MEETGRTPHVKKNNNKKFKWVLVPAVGFVFIIFAIYVTQPFRANTFAATRTTSNMADDEKLQIVETMLGKLKKERGGSKRSFWGKLSRSLPWRQSKGEKLVLIYTGFFGTSPWGWLKDSDALNSWEGLTCPYNCTITYDKSLFKKSDAVVFHAEDLVAGAELNALQLSRSGQQRWIYFPTESPANVPESHVINDMFNWTMSYRPSSDIFRPYGYYHPVKKSYENPDTLLEFLESKDLFSVWIASHCGLMRDKYIRRLKMFMHIDVYGKCGERVGGRSGICTKNSPDCKKHLKRYKFLFAFENSFCTDYVTEKYWYSLMLGIVPVVLGGSSYDSSVAIPGSYINAMDFDSIKELAEYLKSLDNNDKEYNKYFEWKNKYKVMKNAPWNCQLCAALYIDEKPKVYKHLDVFWGRYQQCGRKEDIIKKVIKKQPLKTANYSYLISGT